MEGRATESAFSEHLFEFRAVAARRLALSLTITGVVMVVEIVGGLRTGSIALISDAGHMFTHSFAIAISLVAIVIARRPPCHHRTFGLYRAEILAAFINGLFLLLIVAVMIFEAVLRIINPLEVLGLQMLGVALVGLAVNLASIAILQGSLGEDLNVRSVFYHMVADAASSVGIVVAAVVIFFSGWNILDPLVSLGISALIIRWAWGILKDSTKVLLEVAPTGLNIDIIAEDLRSKFPQLRELYNVHLWTITAGMIVFSAHAELAEVNHAVEAGSLVEDMSQYLADEYGIIQSTIQVTTPEEAKVCEIP
ncbi:MAG: cation diffusion facilitator family transporter [Anaerolineae bacterium]|nr:cation diffusion facilitator family transporter [Anaerolineae bacterium]NIN94156.1 cation diffusion facilitator family transporter [Anaerolineae bacterium]NIQ77198.1 cation diffusion facilitator family transporter [Anaerolineae bacterium]